MPHRTLIEKSCALARSLPSRADALTHTARHFYDGYQLLESASVLQSLAADSGGAKSIAAEVRATAEAAYEAEVLQLAYGAIPSFAQVCERVTARAELLEHRRPAIC